MLIVDVQLQMETGHLFHLARIAKPSVAAKKGKITVAACHMVFAARYNQPGESGFISPEAVALAEPIAGKACLDALISMKIEEQVSLCSPLDRLYVMRLTRRTVASISIPRPDPFGSASRDDQSMCI